MMRLRQAAAGGEADALYRLAQSLVLSGNIEEAFPLHARAASAGHAQAQVECARMLLHGVGAATDIDRAIALLSSAESAGSAVAGYHLALIAVAGGALPFDARANERVLAAVNAGYPPALLAAAVHFGRKPNPADQRLCVELLDRAAGGGNACAAYLLAQRLSAGEGCAADAPAAEALLAPLREAGLPSLPAVCLAPPGPPDSPARTLALEEALQPQQARMLSQRPRMAVIDALLSADECRLLMVASGAQLRESRAVDPVTGVPLRLGLRTSSDASFDPISEDLALRLLQLRLASAAATPLLNAEPLIVLRYLPGQEYRPHRDYLPPAAIQRDAPEAGNRARTLCVYLNEVQAGGETDFPLAGVTVRPSPGSAVVFDSLDGEGLPDPSSLHAGLPVAQGEKWLATLWLRQRRYRWF